MSLRKLKELEAQSTLATQEQTRQIAAQKAELEKQTALLEIERQQLEIERQRVALQRERLELEIAARNFALETADMMVERLYPGVVIGRLNIKQLLIKNLHLVAGWNRI